MANDVVSGAPESQLGGLVTARLPQGWVTKDTRAFDWVILGGDGDALLSFRSGFLASLTLESLFARSRSAFLATEPEIRRATLFGENGWLVLGEITAELPDKEVSTNGILGPIAYFITDKCDGNGDTLVTTMVANASWLAAGNSFSPPLDAVSVHWPDYETRCSERVGDAIKAVIANGIEDAKSAPSITSADAIFGKIAGTSQTVVVAPATPLSSKDEASASVQPTADWVPHGKFGLSFLAPASFSVETDDEKLLTLWSGPPDPRTPTPGYTIIVAQISPKDFDRYENNFAKATERFEVDLGGMIFSAKRLQQGAFGVSYGRLTLAAMSKKPIAGDRHLVITIASKKIEPETALPLFDGILATASMSGSPNVGAAVDSTEGIEEDVATDDGTLPQPSIDVFVLPDTDASDTRQAEPVVPTPPVAPAVAEAPMPQVDQALELAFWNAIADSDDLADFEAYLDQFPKGVFAALARNKIARLTKDAASSPADPVVLAPPVPTTSQQTAVDYAGQHEWMTYTNDRYGTSISYPADVFSPLPPPANDDGRRFVSGDGRASFYVFAQYTELAQSLAQLFNNDQARAGEQVTYKKLGPNWFVVSGHRGSDQFYRKTMLSADGLIQVFKVSYPPELSNAFDSIITTMAKSFAGSGDGSASTMTSPTQKNQNWDAVAPQTVLDTGWWVILASFPTEPWERQSSDFNKMQAAAAPCGLAIFNDLSGKFNGFRAGYNVFVLGAFESKSAANTQLTIARKCFPDAYVKYGEYLGE